MDRAAVCMISWWHYEQMANKNLHSAAVELLSSWPQKAVIPSKFAMVPQTCSRQQNIAIMLVVDTEHDPYANKFARIMYCIHNELVCFCDTSTASKMTMWSWKVLQCPYLSLIFANYTFALLPLTDRANQWHFCHPPYWAFFKPDDRQQPQHYH